MVNMNNVNVLRQISDKLEPCYAVFVTHAADELTDAATEIERLKSDNGRLRAELAAERERCAQIAETSARSGFTAKQIAAAIRRGE